jgi:iron complex outermembrane receptor protein
MQTTYQQWGINNVKSALLGASMVALATALATPVFAADAGTGAEVIVTGTRTTGMKAADSAAPIEVVGAAALTQTGATDLSQVLETTVPSLNINTNGGDMAALSIQAALRGLSPNDTLVLVDGKRRHTTSNLSVDGGSPYSGAATTDLSFIPVGAIDHIEVLTDGAAAQYGTDAIAGVVNVILKSKASGGSASALAGEFYNGQGKTGNLSLNRGFSLGENGFLNLTLEERYHEDTVQGCGDARVTNSSCALLSGLSYPNSNSGGAANFPSLNRLHGDPAYNLYNVFYNAGYDIGGGAELYSFGSYGNRVASHFENIRLPNKVSGNECAGVGATCVTPGAGALVYPFPYGFDPSEQIMEQDYSFTGGIKGNLSGWHYDLSSTYGADINQINVINSANAQLFPVLQAYSTTPITPQTNFNNGRFETTQWTNTLDLDRSFAVGLAAPLNVAFGIEQRHETYTITAGEPSSYYGAGAQSFDGYTPFDAGTHSRDNYAGYVDLATDPITNLHIDLAARYEHYSDFGGTTVGKATGRYDFSPEIAIRGTVSTGFRAPTLAEEYYSGTNVSPYSAQVQLPPNSAPAAVAGFSPLKPEKSTNYSIGFVAHPIPKLQITADIYEIQLNNRILTSGNIYWENGGTIYSPAVLAAIQAKGVTLDSGLSYVAIALFANAANTRTDGAEVTADYTSDFGDMGHVDWSLGFNYNDTVITHLTPLPAIVTNVGLGQTEILDATARTALTSAVPKEKLILQAHWTMDRWSANLRETVYGPSSQIAETGVNNTISTTGITSLLIGYKITKQIKLEAGADNLFDTLPPKLNPAQAGGRVFQVPNADSPWGTDGGFYYGRLTFTF